ncbi:MarR family winged helix-turn-helix transcriptional regulator [Nonomuraea spiralis]|uniref:MarR family winged helix-turn-helix transcriptional regulator n=1 Tax=Nonomuraea TaxID=83681 RepID=UPI00163CB122|nr:hypothetical protein [Nonomuraea sp. WAC 01424]
MDKPLGYWLMHLHNLLEEQFARTLADLGLSRRQWQALNLLSRGDTTREELTTALTHFSTDGGPDPLAGLTARGWAVSTGGGAVALTEAGRATHLEASKRVEGSRATVLGGLTLDQYAETIRTLSVMAGNVEADLARS